MTTATPRFNGGGDNRFVLVSLVAVATALFVCYPVVAVTTAYGGDDRIVHRAVTTASQYTICVCLRYLRSQFGSGIFSSARVGANASQTMSKLQI